MAVRAIICLFLVLWGCVIVAGSPTHGALAPYDAAIREAAVVFAAGFLSPLDQVAGMLSNLTGFSGAACGIALLMTICFVGATVCLRRSRQTMGAWHAYWTLVLMVALTIGLGAPYVLWRWSVFSANWGAA